jgi:(1->4)-alpha-D-glucan 1-alpha-D-glucosylmutase
MDKAASETKVHTTYGHRNPRYDEALRAFITGVLNDPAFVADLEQFVRPLIDPGRVNSLAQTLLQLTAPGVPDIYQGAELWDFSLVDPDNRRPVDFARRRRLLDELKTLSVETIWRRREEGLPKLWLIQQGLHLRRAHPQWFGDRGSYSPLLAQGNQAEHVVAYVRANNVVAIAPRLVLSLEATWAGTNLTIPSGSWHNALTGAALAGGPAPMADLLDQFPVALLRREE